MTVQIKDADTIRTDFINFLRSAIEENGGPSVTDYNVGSVLNVLTEAFADVLEKYYFDLFQVTKESLENIYNGFNFYKMPGKKALVELKIYIDAELAALSSPTYFSIPRGTTVSTEDGSIVFEIIDDYDSSSIIVSASGEFTGKAEYSVRALAVNDGTEGNVAQNAITKFVSSITNTNNFSYWIRNSSASGGTDAESEEDMKARFQKYLISMRRGTKESLEYALASNAAFTGLMYSISGYRHLYVVKQRSGSIDTNNYDIDLTLNNKFYPSYSLLTDEDAATASTSDPFYLYIGSDEKFFNVLFSTQSIPNPATVGSYDILSTSSNPTHGGIQYWDSNSQSWQLVTPYNIITDAEHPLVEEQYISWTLDSTRWGKCSIRDYSAYFIRIPIVKSDSGLNSYDVFKTMTYPFPGYIDIYCLKNYRDNVTDDDKQLITESIDAFKAAGVITTVSNASVIQLHPTIIIQTSNLTSSLIPSDIVESIINDVTTFSNGKNISIDFYRNELY